MCLGLCLLACDGVPKPEEFDLEILQISATVEDESVTLFARVNSTLADNHECGFLYGQSEDDLIRCTSKLINGKFSTTISALEYSKEYIYRAFVSNGRNIIYSETGSFISPSELPSGDMNDCALVYNVELSHVYQNNCIAVLPIDFVLCGSGGGDWLDGFYCASGALYAIVLENISFETRRTSSVVVFTWPDKQDPQAFTVNVTQYSCLDIVDFKDPKVKEICLSQWDTNSDGELWFHEVTSVIDLDPSPFADADFVSFDEFRFFNNVSLPDFLFEGSTVVSVSLPTSYIEGTGKGIFKDCRYLENVDLGGRDVETEAFMNCSSLKRVPRMRVVGERAFMGCTSLEDVVQRNYSVPEMAFKNCSNLRSFSFDPIRYLPENERIGTEAFYGCTSLSEITVHREITSIDSRAFYGCSSLKSVYFSSITPPFIAADAFVGTHPDLKFYVLAPLVGIYKSKWPDLADRIVAAE